MKIDGTALNQRAASGRAADQWTGGKGSGWVKWLVWGRIIRCWLRFVRANPFHYANWFESSPASIPLPWRNETHDFTKPFYKFDLKVFLYNYPNMSYLHLHTRVPQHNLWGFFSWNDRRRWRWRWWCLTCHYHPSWILVPHSWTWLDPYKNRKSKRDFQMVGILGEAKKLNWNVISMDLFQDQKLSSWSDVHVFVSQVCAQVGLILY